MSFSSVVRIYATAQRPDYDNPWQSRAPSSGTGSGVVVGDGQILTGAHVVADGTFVQVQKVADPSKYVAEVAAVCHDADLALLQVNDPGFMDGISIEPIGELPQLRDRVQVVGYPVGGEEISITEGVVSRIEVQRYTHSRRRLLAVTVDAAINDGNSGGPVFMDGKVVGIAFQSLKNADNIGEMVPDPLIKHFLGGIDRAEPNDNGPVRVLLPELGLKIQSLESPLLHKRSGLAAKQSGVLIRGVEHGGSSSGVLQVGDALLKLDGLVVANNGTVRYRGRYRTSCGVVLGERYIGDTLTATILRDGKEIQVKLTLNGASPLVRRSQYDVPPVFFLYGGLVFQVLSLDFLRTWKDWWENAPAEFLHFYYSGSRTAAQQEVVVLTQILADEINVGFEGFHNESVRTVNGEYPCDLQHFVKLVDSAKEVVEIEMSSGRLIVFDPETVRERAPIIRQRYRIPKGRSDGLPPRRAAPSGADAVAGDRPAALQ